MDLAASIKGNRTDLVGSKANERLALLYASHATSAKRLAYLLTRDEHAAEDVVQDAFARLGTKLLTLRDPERAAGYLLRTVANLSRSHGRSQQRDRNLQERLDRARPSPAPDLDGRDEVAGALQQLPQRQRTALFLRYYLDMSEADAARVLDLSIPAMKSLTHRATESLRKELKRHD